MVKKNKDELNRPKQDTRTQRRGDSCLHWLEGFSFCVISQQGYKFYRSPLRATCSYITCYAVFFGNLAKNVWSSTPRSGLHNCPVWIYSCRVISVNPVAYVAVSSSFPGDRTKRLWKSIGKYAEGCSPKEKKTLCVHSLLFASRRLGKETTASQASEYRKSVKALFIWQINVEPLVVFSITNLIFMYFVYFTPGLLYLARPCSTSTGSISQQFPR